MDVAGVKRDAQRQRTRRAVVQAAAALLAEGRTPSVAEIADAAEVSRRTVYLYFPTIEQLLADAALEAASRDTIEPGFSSSGDAGERVEALVRVMHQNAEATEHLGRTIIRHTIEPRADDGGGVPRRGYRRVAWIEQALEPARERLSDERYEQLVSAFTLLIGWEPLIVLRDTRGLTAAQAEEVCAWAAQALLTAALARE
jgi:AcrR family transcriptional regulator